MTRLVHCGRFRGDTESGRVRDGRHQGKVALEEEGWSGAQGKHHVARKEMPEASEVRGFPCSLFGDISKCLREHSQKMELCILRSTLDRCLPKTKRSQQRSRICMIF
jgi:hypothetical protein